MKVSKWGNSLAIRLTSELAERLDVNVGDEVDFRLNTDGDGFTMRKKLSKQELRERVRTMRGMMPAGFKFDRDEIYEK